MHSTRVLSLCLLLVAAPAFAQVVTREVGQESVETTAPRSPNEAAVTRWPLPPAGIVSVQPGVAPAYSTYGPLGWQVYPGLPAANETVRGPPAVNETVGASVGVGPVAPDLGVRTVRTITVRPPARTPAATRPTPVSRPGAKRMASTRRVARTQTTGAGRTRRGTSVLRSHVTTRKRTRAGAAGHATRALVRRTAARRRVGRPLALALAPRRAIGRHVAKQRRVAPPPVSTRPITSPITEEVVVPPTASTGYAFAYPATPAPPPAVR